VKLCYEQDLSKRASSSPITQWHPFKYINYSSI
jgi:hypothetical protein